MHKLNGGCHCGNILVEIFLARSSSEYNPRACDCDFCRKHGALYVSDPLGPLLIRIKDEREIGRYRQGSGIADCLLCRNCGVLVGALYPSDGRLYATVNTKIIDDRVKFSAQIPISPKKVSENEKTERWRAIWFTNVRVIDVEAS
jgi:hypothetical protein